MRLRMVSAAGDGPSVAVGREGGWVPLLTVAADFHAGWEPAWQTAPAMCLAVGV